MLIATPSGKALGAAALGDSGAEIFRGRCPIISGRAAPARCRLDPSGNTQPVLKSKNESCAPTSSCTCTPSLVLADACDGVLPMAVAVAPASVDGSGDVAEPPLCARCRSLRPEAEDGAAGALGSALAVSSAAAARRVLRLSTTGAAGVSEVFRFRAVLGAAVLRVEAPDFVLLADASLASAEDVEGSAEGGGGGGT